MSFILSSQLGKKQIRDAVRKAIGDSDLPSAEVQQSILSRLDVPLSTRASEDTLSTLNNKIPNPTANGNMPIALAEDTVGVARDSTLQVILGKLDVNLSTRASESTLSALNNKIPNPTANGNLPIALAEDAIGVAKDSTLQSILGKLDVALSTRASESTLSAINSKIPSPTANGNLPIALAEDTVGVAKDSTLQSILSQLDVALSTRASEATLQQVASNTARPTAVHSAVVTIDNSTGTSDLVQQLFSQATPSKQATLYLWAQENTSTVYIGDSNSQDFPLEPGGVFSTHVSDLSAIYVRVPAGVKAVIRIVWEV